jgi:hypothetical protein
MLNTNQLKRICLLFLLFPLGLMAQDNFTIKGRVTDTTGTPLVGANVIFKNTTIGAICNELGYFNLKFSETKVSFPATLVCSYIGYADFEKLFKNSDDLVAFLQVQLSESNVIDSFEVKGNRGNDYLEPVSIDPAQLEFSPTINASVEDLLKTMLGGPKSELSNQYSVRGGNYDENLVYVNGFEIYRPFLMRAGQQEGLSFINPDLVRAINFSTGGFEAEYGDKMSSVLDIKYKRPTEFAGSVSGSMRGASIHFEGTNKNNHFMYLTGVRYKNNAAILRSLDTKGQYNPNALDVQTNLIWQNKKNLEFEVLFNHSFSAFELIPSESSTTTGAINQAIRFSVFFEGNERDYFRNTMGGLALRYYKGRVSTTFQTSAFRMKESENFNIIGQYRLDEVETDFSSDDFGDVKATLGVGTYHDWGRNELDATVANITNKGTFNYKDHLFQWGNTFQYEIINDALSEWERLDSAGYSLPYNGEQVTLFTSLKSTADLDSWRIHGHVQNVWNFLKENGTDVVLNVGLRYLYWNLNQQTVVSPRAQLAISPKPKKDNRFVVFKIATGIYEQPPFYRELRDREGVINNDVLAQRSVHALFGVDFVFKTWNERNFKLSAETFYKHLSNVNPYELDDIRIRYAGNNAAKGYAYGADVRLFGELVPGAESWISISYLKIREDLNDDSYTQITDANGNVVSPFIQNVEPFDTTIIYPGHIAKPTEQVFNFGMFFSDYMTKNKNFKMHLALNFGTGLPYGPPDGNRYTDVLRAPGYKRVDIGFSALLVGGEKKKESRREPSNFGKHFDKVWVSAEIFNLLGNQNTISYRWITDVQNNRWPIPNYLTSRRFNVNLHIKFS